MSHLRIALLQIAPCGCDVEKNLAKGLEYFRRASKRHHADIAVLPELWSVGYLLPGPLDEGGLDEWQELAVSRDSDFVRAFADRARVLEMAVAVPYLERTDAGVRNTVTLFDRRGREVFTYAKTHVCGWGPPESVLEPGDRLESGTLDTRLGPVEVGALICFDREFPEANRVLMRRGTELVLIPNACDLVEGPEGLDGVRIAQLRGRAFEGYMAMAMANYPAPQNDGHSILVNADGGVVVEAGRDEEIVVADLDLEGLRAYREREREREDQARPELYGALVEGSGWDGATPSKGGDS